MTRPRAPWLAAARVGMRVALLMLLATVATGAASAQDVHVALPPVALTAADLAIIVNDADALSVRIGAYYARRRGIPAARVIHVSFPAGRVNLGADEFRRIKAEVDARTPAAVQAYALTWVRPYRVDCMSITTAFAAGFDPAYCADGCKLTRRSPYFDSDSVTPHKDFGLRPTMMVGANDFDTARALIDRGVRADDSQPDGTAYLLSTSDAARNVRAVNNAGAVASIAHAYRITEVRADAIEDKRDVMFYFTGLGSVARIDSNVYLDGAMADHLTSAGGMLTDSPQMSSLRWIEAGATGSYGAVAEPCNYLSKFPVPVVAMARYLDGETLIEAYWKSVLMPGQGVFIGEPLARPFGGVRMRIEDGTLLIESRAIRDGAYTLYAGDSDSGPWTALIHGTFSGFNRKLIRVPDASKRYYRLVREAAPDDAAGIKEKPPAKPQSAAPAP